MLKIVQKHNKESKPLKLKWGKGGQMSNCYVQAVSKHQFKNVDKQTEKKIMKKIVQKHNKGSIKPLKHGLRVSSNF